jgi:hypothetical protein
MLTGAGILHGGCVPYLIDKFVPRASFMATRARRFFSFGIES